MPVKTMTLRSNRYVSLSKQRVDLVIISANESEPVTTAAVEAFRAGIPTIIIDRKIYSEEYTTFIGADNYEIGRAAGLFVNSLLKKKEDNDCRSVGARRFFFCPRQA